MEEQIVEGSEGTTDNPAPAGSDIPADNPDATAPGTDADAGIDPLEAALNEGEAQVEPGESGEAEAEAPRLYAGKYKTPEELEKAYDHTQAQTTRLAQEKADLDRHNETLRKHLEAVQPQQPGESAEDAQQRKDEAINKFAEDPEKYMSDFVGNALANHNHAAAEYKSAVDSAQNQAFDAIEADPNIGALSDEMKAGIKDVLKNNPILSGQMNAVTQDNFRSGDLVPYYTDLLKLAATVAKGNMSDNAVETARATAASAEKAKQTKARTTGVLTPSGKTDKSLRGGDPAALERQAIMNAEPL